jgi:hypothetical protein
LTPTTLSHVTPVTWTITTYQDTWLPFGVSIAVSGAAFQAFVVAGISIEDYGSLKVQYDKKSADFAGHLFAVAVTYTVNYGSHKVLYYIPLGSQCSLLIQFHLLSHLLFSEDRVFGQSSTSRASAQAGLPRKVC